MKARPLSPEETAKKAVSKTLMFPVELLLELEGVAREHNRRRNEIEYPGLPGAGADTWAPDGVGWRRLTWADVLRISAVHYCKLVDLPTKKAPRKVAKKAGRRARG